jgi:aerobic carbon-monoxide dehydrogenase medium subunit
MYTAPFHYLRPKTIEEAEKLFAKAGDAKYLAGGQTLIPTMKQRLAAPSALIDIARIPGLGFVRRQPDCIVIGAATPHAQVAGAPSVKAAIPALAALAGLIGDPAVRNKGTLGGSIANNDPAADYPAALLGLGATVITTRRAIAADGFFTAMFETALEEGELVKEVSFPIPARCGYAKFPNPASRYAMVGVFVAQFSCAVRVAVTGAAPCVFRQSAMEAALSKRFAPEALASIAVSPDGLNCDLHGSDRYRSHLVGVMAKRAVATALG